MKNILNNGLMDWALAQPQSSAFHPSQLTRIIDSQEFVTPDFWRSSATNNKVLASKVSRDFGPNLPLDPNKTTILGGMCLINTVEMKHIYNREITFATESEFEAWFAGWYPRIDQIHDTVGIPPRTCRKIVYVSEDSFFAGRLASYTGLDKTKIQSILRRVHERQGHLVLARYLKAFGYSGDLSVIYTSDIEKEMSVALKMWERLLGTTFRNCDRDFAKVELMYTGFWLDILGIRTSAIIYESASKMILKGWLKLDEWFKEQAYGMLLNRNLGIVGYLPFITTKGDSSVLEYNEVPNCQNYRTFVMADDDIPWYVVNLLFTKKVVVEQGPTALSKGRAVGMIANDLSQYFNL